MRQTTEEQLEQIWNAALSGDIAPNASRTVDQWGNEMTIFDGWREVEQLADLVYSILPADFIADNAPTFEHLKFPVDARHHIEWAIGDFGFSDQFETCSHCYVAIDIYDSYPRYYYDGDLGEIVCDDCLRKDSAKAEDYLSHCARHLEDSNREIARPHFVEPHDHGYIALNPYSAYGEYAYGDFLIKYEGIENFPLEDHSEFPRSLSYADDKDLARLAKAVKLIDPSVMLLASYIPSGYGGYLYWAKFETEVSDDPAVNLAILQYAIGCIFAKYQSLRNQDNGTGARSSVYDAKGG